MVPLRRGTSRFLLLITCYPQEPHTGTPSPSHSTEVSVVYIGLDPSLDNYLLVEPYIPAPPPSTRAVIHLSTRGMVPLRHGTSRFLLLITRYKPSLRLVPRRHFASTTRVFLVYLFSRTRRRRFLENSSPTLSATKHGARTSTPSVPPSSHHAPQPSGTEYPRLLDYNSSCRSIRSSRRILPHYQVCRDIRTVITSRLSITRAFLRRHFAFE